MRCRIFSELRGGDVMALRFGVPAHIAYELFGEIEPKVVVIEFLTREIAGPFRAQQCGEQLCALIDPESPRYFVLDFRHVRSIGSTGFAELVSFVRKAGRVTICNMPPSLELGASIIGLDEFADFAPDRQSAIDAALRATDWRRGALAPEFVS